MKTNIIKTFSDLNDRKSALEAFGFYILHLFIGIGLVFALSFLASLVIPFNPVTANQIGFVIGSAFAVVYSFVLVLLLTKRKGIKGNKRIIFVALTLVSSVLGLVGGLILPALLTTQDKKVIG